MSFPTLSRCHCDKHQRSAEFSPREERTASCAGAVLLAFSCATPWQSGSSESSQLEISLGGSDESEESKFVSGSVQTLWLRMLIYRSAGGACCVCSSRGGGGVGRWAARRPGSVVLPCVHPRLRQQPAGCLWHQLAQLLG